MIASTVLCLLGPMRRIPGTSLETSTGCCQRAMSSSACRPHSHLAECNGLDIVRVKCASLLAIRAVVASGSPMKYRNVGGLASSSAVAVVNIVVYVVAVVAVAAIAVGRTTIACCCRFFTSSPVSPSILLWS